MSAHEFGIHLDEWRALGGHVEVSDEGRVRYRGELVPTRKGPRGVLFVELPSHGRRSVHHLVIAAFVGPIVGKKVGFKDGDMGNPSLENLIYKRLTRGRRLGKPFFPPPKEVRRRMSVEATPEALATLCTMLNKGDKHADIAKALQVSRQTVWRWAKRLNLQRIRRQR